MTRDARKTVVSMLQYSWDYSSLVIDGICGKVDAERLESQPESIIQSVEDKLRVNDVHKGNSSQR